MNQLAIDFSRCVVPEPTTQQGQILRALQRGERLTPLDSLSKYGVLALSQRVGELIRMGWPIVRTTTKTPTGKTVGLYFMGH